jgi:hypothetical protein
MSGAAGRLRRFGRSILSFFAPLAPYCFDDCLWFAELDHVPAFFGDDMGGSRG